MCEGRGGASSGRVSGIIHMPGDLCTPLRARSLSQLDNGPRPGKARVSGSSGHSMQGFQAKEMQS